MWLRPRTRAGDSDDHYFCSSLRWRHMPHWDPPPEVQGLLSLQKSSQLSSNSHETFIFQTSTIPLISRFLYELLLPSGRLLTFVLLTHEKLFHRHLMRLRRPLSVSSTFKRSTGIGLSPRIVNSTLFFFHDNHLTSCKHPFDGI